MRNENEFLKYIKDVKRYSNHTLVAYQNDLKQFFAYLSGTYGITNMEEVQFVMIRSWIVSLIEQTRTASSVKRKISTLKSYYKYLLREGIVPANPMLMVQPPKGTKQLPVFLDQTAMDLLFDKVDFGTGFNAIRDRLLLELLYATGMRLSELIGIRSGDIDKYNGSVKVLGKRNKERIIPLFPAILDLMEEYLRVRSELETADQGDFLLVTDRGVQLYPKFVYRTVNRYLSEITTLRKKSPHILRHTFATHLLNKGADINAIKEILGHSSLSATQVYTHNTVEKLKAAHKQAHPKA